MNSKDDRAEFAAHQTAQSLALGRDNAVFERSVEAVLDFDRYDYSYLWNWMGVPIIQMPADIMATQEVVWNTKPDVIIETGVARGGSVLMMAGLLKMMDIKGKVVGVDIDIRAHNRESIEAHPLSSDVVLIEGGSVHESTLAKVRAEIPDGARVMVVLDSDHSRDHVLAECRAYGALVTEGCYMVVADTIVGYFNESNAPRKRSKLWFEGNEPLAARDIYLAETERFEVDQALNGKLVVSSSPGGYLRCISP